MVDMVIAELAEINGGEIKVVRDDEAEVEKQGITILGVPVGTPEYSARQWREVFEKKKMHLKAFLGLTAQEQLLMIRFCEQRFNHMIRTDMHPEASLECRKEIDTYLFGTDKNIQPGAGVQGTTAVGPGHAHGGATRTAPGTRQNDRR